MTGWRDKAACRGHNTELFFPTGSSGPALEQVMKAKQFALVATCAPNAWSTRCRLTRTQGCGAVWTRRSGASCDATANAARSDEHHHSTDRAVPTGYALAAYGPPSSRT
jgi:hypothetical protein